MKSMMKLLCGALVTCVLGSLPVCYGQNVSGMTGEVSDTSGAVVVGALVTLTNSATGLKFAQTTNSAGVYRFASLPPGPGYEAVFSFTGFSPLDR